MINMNAGENNTLKEYEETLKLGMSNGMTIEHKLFKEKVISILKQPIQNLDLSWEYVDQRFIEKIEKL